MNEVALYSLPSCFGQTDPLPTNLRFIALDVETAAYDVASICQIGLAFVGFDGAITTHSAYIDPQMPFAAGNTRLHGISATTVQNAPSFADILPDLRPVLEAIPLVQHSRFDEKAFDAACRQADLPILKSRWSDSVAIARQAWPELKGNGGHGLANLKQVLNLQFKHHDAGEDARAAAQVVLKAEAAMGRKIHWLNAAQQLAFNFG
ncbi:exonuclease domain-containing protein [Aestuariibius sp. HNIBRBA575]|uniref:exonuclease domain-containing protein n=1 Tax=Aestuariibius sp. HNIBRBA575 TaxID=3233343 RepID=UPI0034A2B71F